ncbi:MAG TPA: hypothetical protein DGX96_02435 [Lachnospiraceae bacterium]|nr:hypothetical protein [Lachnospiraceae bacterium]
MDTAEVLEKLRKLALEDRELRKELLQTRTSKTPLSDFCKIATKAGCPLYEMDVIAYGEESYAALRRSTNGGGENSPALAFEDDPYELLLSELERVKD